MDGGSLFWKHKFSSDANSFVILSAFIYYRVCIFMNILFSILPGTRTYLKQISAFVWSVKLVCFCIWQTICMYIEKTTGAVGLYYTAKYDDISSASKRTEGSLKHPLIFIFCCSNIIFFSFCFFCRTCEQPPKKYIHT